MRRFVEGTDRGQRTLFPECLEDWIGEDNPVRVIDVFVEELELAGLGFSGVDPEAPGRPSYHPSVLLKLYIYGYLNRVQSSRRLEREAGRNVEVMCGSRAALFPITRRLPTSARTMAARSGRSAPGLLRSVAPWACSQKPPSRSMAANSRRLTTVTRTSRAPRWTGAWRGSSRASRAICSSSTPPTGRSRPRRSKPRRPALGERSPRWKRRVNAPVELRREYSPP